MRLAVKALITLYPKAWRNRYETEYLALLDAVPPTWRTFFNVLGGGMKMQFKIWSSWKIVAAFGVAGVLAAAAYSLTIPKRYVSQALIRVQTDGNKDEADEDLNAIAQAALSRASLTGIMLKEGLYQKERGSEPIEDIVERMRGEDIRVTRASTAPAFIIAFGAADAASAQRVTAHLVSAFMDEAIRSHADQQIRGNETFELLDAPSLPISPVSPRLSKIAIMGLVAGILAGVLFALFQGLNAWKLAAALGLAGFGLGAAAAYLMPAWYSSTAVVRFSAADGAQVNQTVRSLTSPANLAAIITQFELYPKDPAAQQKLREHLHFRPIQRPRADVGAMVIQFDYADRHVAQVVTQDMVSRLIVGSKNVKMLDPASLPWHPMSPNRPVIEGMGLFLGLAAALVLGARRTLRTA